MVHLRVTNVVAMFTVSDFGYVLKLDDVVTRLHAVYNPRKCYAAHFSVDGVKVMVWKSSKVQLLGASSEEHCKRVAERVVRLFQGSGYCDVGVNDFRIVTVSGTFSLRTRIDVTGAVGHFGGLYDPELSNSAIVHYDGRKALVYPTTGTVIMCGFSSETNCINTLTSFERLLAEFVLVIQ